MISPSNNSQTFPKRKRRIARESEGGSVRSSQPQKKRSRIDPGIFDGSAQDGKLNGHALNGHHSAPEESFSQLTSEIPTRSKLHKRPLHNTRSSLLTETASYSARSIPNLPEPLRGLDRGTFRVHLASPSHSILAVTKNQALIWDPVSGVSNTHTLKVINLPTPAKDDEPVPLGALVSHEHRQTGLLIVSATTGQISYWENYEDAEASSLLQKSRVGIEGNVDGLMSGETIDAIQNAGHADYLLLFNSGRTAQLLLRDAQSRPAIAVRFLRGEINANSSGFLGGLKTALLGSGWLRKVVAAKARSSASKRGQSNVLLVNEDARFQRWQLGWPSQANLLSEVDAHKHIHDRVLQSLGNISKDELATQIKIVDFEFTNDQDSLPGVAHARQPAQDTSVILLVAFSGGNSTSFALVELSIVDAQPMVGSVRHLRSYMSPLAIHKAWKPKLILSMRARTAFVIFDKAISIISLANNEALSVQSLEETLHLREDEDISCVGAEVEADRTREVAVLAVFIRSFGIVQITVSEPDDYQEAARRSSLSIEANIKQAVFYGQKPNTPFDFSRAVNHPFSITDVEVAVRKISEAILVSDIPGGLAADVLIQHQLAVRAGYMHNLALHLKHAYPRLSRATRWNLLWDAEKIASAEQTWRVYEQRRSSSVETRRFLPDLVDQMSEEYQPHMEEDRGEVDVLRSFFTKSIKHMDAVVFWAFKALSYDVEAGEVKQDTPEFIEFLSDAAEIVISVLGQAFKFRQESAWTYNLDDESLEDGLLDAAGYRGLSSPWTSEMKMLVQVHKLLGSILEALTHLADAQPELQPSAQTAARRTVGSVPALIGVLSMALQERSRCVQCSSSAERRLQATEIDQMRRDMLLQALPELFDLGEVEAAYALAEQHQEMPALVALFREEVALAQSMTDESASRQVLSRLDTRQRQWFDKFGQQWADEFFGNLFDRRRYMSLLTQSSTNRTELTRFLRSDGSRAKISWINEVMVEKDFLRAGTQLLDDAVRQVNDRVNNAEDEAALAKLCLLAVSETGETPPHFDATMTRCKHVSTLTSVKLDILSQVKETQESGLDAEASIQLITSDWCLEGPDSTLGQIFSNAFASFCIHDAPPSAAVLLDILPLMREASSQHLRNVTMAIDVLQKPNMDTESALYRLLHASTWRRILLRDDWSALNQTDEMSDSQISAAIEKTAFYQVLYAGYQTGKFGGDSVLQIPSPESLLGQGLDPQEHMCRFRDETLCERIAEAVRGEDEQLRRYIEHDRLEHWAGKTARDMAKMAVEQEKEEQARKREELARLVQDMYREDEAGPPQADVDHGLDGEPEDDEA